MKRNINKEFRQLKMVFSNRLKKLSNIQKKKLRWIMTPQLTSERGLKELLLKILRSIGRLKPQNLDRKFMKMRKKHQPVKSLKKLRKSFQMKISR